MRRVDPPEANGASGPARTLDRTVRVSLRQVFLRALVPSLLLCGLLAVPFALYYRAETARARDHAEAIEDRVLHLVDQTISQEVAGVLSDLRFLSQQTEMTEFLAQDTPSAREHLAREYLAFVTQKRRYDQARVIDPDGWERVRVNFNDGRPAIVPDGQLQNKLGRYYFTDAMRLGPGQIYVSPLDLNMEQDTIEQPPKATVRVALALFGRAGERRGILILNYHADRLLDRVRAIGRVGVGSLWLLDARGYWLIGPSQEDEWGFMYPDGAVRSFAARHPDAWQRVSSATEGRVNQGDEGWLRFRRVYALATEPAAGELAAPTNPQGYYWTAASLLPDAGMRRSERRLALELSGGYAALALLVFGLMGALSFVSIRARDLARVMGRVLDSVPILISYVDTEQRYRFTNRAYQPIFGVSPREAYGRTVREVIGEDAYARARPYLERALSGQAVSFENHVDSDRTGPHDLTISWIPDIGAKGEVRGVFAMVSDVTQLKQAERREHQRMLELAHAGRLASVGEMATQLAHEINQPLTALTTYCAACLRSQQGAEGGDAQLREWLQAIDTEARRVSDVVRRLRQFVRKGEMVSSATDLNEVVREVAGMVRRDAEANGVELDLKLGRDLPRVVADRVLVEQVVLNLVRNGLDAVAEVPAGRRRVMVETIGEGQRVEVVVTDSGAGVPEEVAGRLFDAFVTTKANGLGMGLPISRSIVEAHGGDLHYSNNPGGGATFRFGLRREAS